MSASLRFLPLAPLALALLLTACNSGTDTSTATADGTASAAVVEPRNDAGTWYRQYRGVLPGSSDTITLHLQRLGNAPAAGLPSRVVGFYAGSDGHPYELGGDTGSGGTDSLNLRNLSEELAAATADEEDDTPPMPAGPQWRLREQGDQLVGTRNGQAMQLRRVRSGSGMAFGVRRFTTEVLPRPGHPEDSISGRISMQALVPASGTYQADIAAHIRRGLHGDTLDTAPALALDSVWQEHLRLFTRDYRADAAPLLAAAKKNPNDYQPLAALAYEQEANSYVLWNQGDLLSLGFFGYDYSGGAHGMYGTYVQSYDLRTGRVLRFDDIFRAGTKPQLAKLLGQYARPVLGLKASEPLSKALQVKTLPVTRNVYLTNGGAVFVYLPYEIAAFSYGQISVFVPYSDLQPLLKPGLPVSGGNAAVASR